MMNAIENWKLERLNSKSENTRYVYQYHLRRFLDYRKVTADEMAKWDEKKATHELLVYMGHLKQKGMSSKTRALSWNALKSFFRSTGVRIDERAPVKIKERKYRDMVFTKPQIKKILDFAPLQVKLGISLMSFSGLSPSDAVKLTYGHFKYDMERNITPVMLTIKRKKTGNEYVTFVPEQTIRYLKEWLECRQKKEKITDKTRIFRWNNPQYLICKQTEYIKKASITPRNGFRIRNYCFRKYYRQQMMGKVTESLLEFSMGHDTDLPAIYSGIVDLDEEAIKKMREEFAEPLLQIQTEGGVSTEELDKVNEKLTVLEDENRKLKERVNGSTQLKERNAEINVLREELDKVKTDMENYQKGLGQMDDQYTKLIADKEVQTILIKKIKELGIKS